MQIRRALFLFLSVCLLAGRLQADTKQWVHVHIEDANKEEKVKVNIPISLVESLMPMIEEKSIERGRIRLHERDMSIQDLRKVWKELRSQGDSEFVSIENRDTNIRVFTKGNYLMVEPGEGSTKRIEMKIPLAVVDAMLSGQGEELNLTAAVRALKESGSGDIITVKDRDATVRVWIDESNQAR